MQHHRVATKSTVQLSVNHADLEHGIGPSAGTLVLGLFALSCMIWAGWRAFRGILHACGRAWRGE